MVAFVIDENLRLVGQPAKGGRMNDAVAVALKRRSDRMLRLRIEAPASLLRLRRIRGERSDHRHPPDPPGRSVHSAAQTRQNWRRRIASRSSYGQPTKPVDSG